MKKGWKTIKILLEIPVNNPGSNQDIISLVKQDFHITKLECNYQTGKPRLKDFAKVQAKRQA